MRMQNCDDDFVKLLPSILIPELNAARGQVAPRALGQNSLLPPLDSLNQPRPGTVPLY